MEFVEGETLDNLIKRSGPLEVKLALEITMQVGAGLAAVHKRKLVHRDIKPSNIMVSFEEEGVVTAKIIDLGISTLPCRLRNSKAFRSQSSASSKCFSIKIPGGLFRRRPNF